MFCAIMTGLMETPETDETHTPFWQMHTFLPTLLFNSETNALSRLPFHLEKYQRSDGCNPQTKHNQKTTKYTMTGYQIQQEITLGSLAVTAFMFLESVLYADRIRFVLCLCALIHLFSNKHYQAFIAIIMVILCLFAPTSEDAVLMGVFTGGFLLVN